MNAGYFLLAELGDAVGETGDFTARGVAMNDTLLRSADNGGLRIGHGGECGGAAA